MTDRPSGSSELEGELKALRDEAVSAESSRNVDYCPMDCSPDDCACKRREHELGARYDRILTALPTATSPASDELVEAVEAAYREGWWDGHDLKDGGGIGAGAIVGQDWRRSDARAALKAHSNRETKHG